MRRVGIAAAVLAAILCGIVGSVAVSCGVEQPEVVAGAAEAGAAEAGEAGAKIVFSPGTYPYTKSDAPDEDLISDANIFIFNSVGLLEEKVYVKASALSRSDDGGYCYTTRLLQDCYYSIYVCTNIGFSMTCSSVEELLAFKFYLAYPDDYKIGVPMSGVRQNYKYDGSGEIVVPLHRAMAKVSVSVDRGGLNDDVELKVTRVKVGNCPKSVNMFVDSSVGGSDDVYTVGFSKTEGAVGSLNTSVSGQVSGEVSLYMLENLQGNPLGDIDDYSEKVFEDGDAAMNRCSYIELEASYVSDTYYSLPGESLIYRFYIGDSPSDFNVERNCHYHITVRPEGTGLGLSDWRVDKSGLGYLGPTSITVSPGTYIRGDIGDVIHVYCEIVPEEAPFDVGLEELEYYKEGGIYDYEVDEDGMGVTITLTKSGSALLYFEAGDPINDAALVVIEVNLPADSS